MRLYRVRTKQLSIRAVGKISAMAVYLRYVEREENRPLPILHSVEAIFQISQRGSQKSKETD